MTENDFKNVQPTAAENRRADITVGKNTKHFLEKIRNITPGEKETLLDEALGILSRCTDPNLQKHQSETVLAVGYVQSGKTRSFTTLSALASDNGFRIIIYLAGTKNILLEQTHRRLESDLVNDSPEAFKILDNPVLDTDSMTIQNALSSSAHPTTLITLLKNKQHIDNLREIFDDPGFRQVLGYSGVMIIDDEADQASLNGFAYRNGINSAEEWTDDDVSATYNSIVKLRKSIENLTYAQYTATPQGPLLISMMDLLSPHYCAVLTPGRTYSGGRKFFIEKAETITEIPAPEVWHSSRNVLKRCPHSLEDALMFFFLNTVLMVRYFKKVRFLSMMVHPDKLKETNKLYYNWIKVILNKWKNLVPESEDNPGRIRLLERFRDIYEYEVTPSYHEAGAWLPDLSEIFDDLLEVLFDTEIYLVTSDSGSRFEEIKWDRFNANILVGADILNRGYTVENLAVTYMPRHTLSQETADTIWQRCRFFGYKDRYFEACRVYLPKETYLDYYDYVEMEEEMRRSLKKDPNLQDIEHLLITSPTLKITRLNILPPGTITHKMEGWRIIKAFDAAEENEAMIDKYIFEHRFVDWKQYDSDYRNHSYVRLNIQEAIKFLTDFRCPNYPDTSRKLATIRYWDYLSKPMDGAATPLRYIYLWNMAYNLDPENYRERELNTDTMTITNLFTGRTSSANYPGDGEIKINECFNIQIHRIKLRAPGTEWDGKNVCVLAVYYPESYAKNYIEANKTGRPASASDVPEAEVIDENMEGDNE